MCFVQKTKKLRLKHIYVLFKAYSCGLNKQGGPFTIFGIFPALCFDSLFIFRDLGFSTYILCAPNMLK